jgi:hypothetical protein
MNVPVQERLWRLIRCERHTSSQNHLLLRLRLAIDAASRMRGIARNRRLCVVL